MSEFVLGQQSAYPNQYDPGLLFPIPRAQNRKKLGIEEGSRLPFLGIDFWNAFELSWLNPKGKPQIGIAEFSIPAE